MFDKASVNDYSDEQLRKLINELGPAHNKDTHSLVTIVREWAEHSRTVHLDTDVVDEECEACILFATRTVFGYGMTVEQLGVAYRGGNIAPSTDRLGKLLNAVLKANLSMWDL